MPKSTTLPNLRHIRLLVAFADKGSLTSAAEALHITQPAASQALHALEAALGASLIGRSDMTLTAEGEAALVRFRRISEFVRHAPAAPRLASRLDTLLSWSHLRAVAAFLAHGSFSAAARGLGQSEPAVQRAAREAETIMGVALFEGNGRTIRLTTAGQNAARAFNLAIGEFESARADLLERLNRFESKVSIGTLPLTRTFLVPDAVARLAETYPLAQFEILEGSYDNLLFELERGRIDILVGALRPSFDPRVLEQERLFDYELKVVSRADHPLTRSSSVTMADLARHGWVIARQGTPSRQTFDAMAATFPKDLPVRQSVETGSLNIIRGVLLKTDHLTLLSSHQIRYDLEAGFLAVVDCPVPQSRRLVGLTVRKHWLPTRLQAEFLAALREGSMALTE
ncbi:MAG: LysR family transcriptional regulator [Rhizobium sp.]|nr:LysR family transcriptional regulator [Rhizobium sp.]